MKRYIKSAISSNYIVILSTEKLFRDSDGYVYDLGSDDIVAEVNSFEEASRAVRDFIDVNDLGASEFSGGDVFDMTGKKVANISYNGRIWLPGDRWF